MLLNDFYRIEELRHVEGAQTEDARNEVSAIIALDTIHPIFEGHFPGKPVVPGACELEIIQELLSHSQNRSYRLLRADQVKFLTVIDPRVYPRIEVAVKYSAVADDPIQVTASLSAGDTIFLKFTGAFLPV